MPVKQEQRAEVNNFSAGYITEASQLVFPPNSLLDVNNFVINRDGSVSRRFGMELESGGHLLDTGIDRTALDSDSVNSFNWKEVGGDNTKEFIVIQIGNKLMFFDAFAEITSDAFIGSVTIAAPANVSYSLTSTEGILVVATGQTDITVVEYDKVAATFSTSTIRILTRDVWGVEDTDPAYNTSDNYRGGPVDAKRRYNLQNQSWGIPRRNVSDPAGDNYPYVDPLTSLVTNPSNSQTIWLGITTRPSRSFSDGTGGIPYEGFATSVFSGAEGKLPSAAKGYFIIDALDRGYSRGVAVANNLRDFPTLTWYAANTFPADRTLGGATVVSEFAGRVFYSGFSGEVTGADSKSPNFSNFVFFSQVIKNKRDLNKCYQDGDPTSRDAPDVIDTDGGFLRISEAIDIISMFPLGGGLLVLASNGVWMIRGGSDYGFSATNYKVDKLSEFGVAGTKTVVREGSSAYFWSNDSIFIVAKDQFGDFKVNSITLKKIQKFYDAIPSTSKSTAIGVYNPNDKTLRWVYTDNGTKELVLDILQGCFYKNSIDAPIEAGISIIGVFRKPPFTVYQNVDDVFVGNNQVIAGVDDVSISGDQLASINNQMGYVYADNSVVSTNVWIGFSNYTNENFYDFEIYDSAATLITGTSVAGDSGSDKQIPYLISHFERTENVADGGGNLSPASSCLMRGQWSFANAIESHKWSPAQQIYRLNKPYPPIVPGQPWNSGFRITTTKSKVRGKGPAFALSITTEPGKDCRLVGWSLTINGSPIT